ncbi:glycoside hydrolase family 130 protein [Phycisphaera mikurensis]|uniref:Glycosidase n=1 Tax=Phycisphaera mikurensis (strain NBRC 102666 / KCTC 22515 / FYK2301M01) TaxID=1142394 RepID=I0IEI8_PHYMF|nr:glycoside hydrolase family 130 protein [Phycisphaera mikurensis]MBB6441475.1 putative GH43/DUF377 family glycosyl hydrolase [Phycisphaera mikurensis]BAM03676.1 hypothetical protein PSMK_15170 [Phycisphaera mikurensis NBRC 102666]
MSDAPAPLPPADAAGTGWAIGPFEKLDDANPVLLPRPDAAFDCPLAGRVRWEQKDVFNPAAVVRGGRLHLLYRAEDAVGRCAGTSRIGLAGSDDGTRFERRAAPVLFPRAGEGFTWPGGCEDPRVVEDDAGRLVMTFTAYDGERARLCVATSQDLLEWTNHGPAFVLQDGRYADLWSKSGSIVCRATADGRMVARRVHGRYWMYFGESQIFCATSDDLIRWEVVEHVDHADRTFVPGVGNLITPGVAVPRPVAGVRAGRFDAWLIEPGPPALWAADGIRLLYNGVAATEGRSQPGTVEGARRYCPGQLLFDPDQPTEPIRRLAEPMFVPDRPYERTGQVDGVCFIEGLAWFREAWWLYYGTADSAIAAARCVPG